MEEVKKKFKVFLIGDNCTDIYRYGTVDRISPEAPVPIFKLSYEEQKPGMAANVLANLEAFGIEVQAYLGLKSEKTRLIDIKSRQHIVRIDNDVISKSAGIENIGELNFYDAVIISDYNKGWISYQLVKDIRKNYLGPIFVDSKKTDLEQFNGCFVKVNEKEYSESVTQVSNMIVTLGSGGARYQDQLYTVDKVEVVDVCGAGDTFLAALVFEYLNTSSIKSAIQFANRAGAICVQHSGVYTLTKQDIESIRKF
jgi:D-beta-D-heptose 7-phosphate kinase/D-beta-D-heptose 1-phosphate adenosyltransferase